MICCDGYVVRNTREGERCWRMSIAVPYCGAVQPGQFVHLRVDSGNEVVLRRPFSIYEMKRFSDALTNIDILYTIVGRGTAILKEKRPLETVGFLGPLGKGFRIDEEAKEVVCVAGGIGIVPFLPLFNLLIKKKKKTKLTLLFGARSADDLYGLRDFDALPVDVEISTDDGSAGRKGLVTELLSAYLRRKGIRRRNVQVYACGPERMMAVVSAIAKSEGVACQLSLEKRMGCALGACGACVVKRVKKGETFYSRICVDGPVYDANEVILE